MNIIEAVKAALTGKRIRRSGWYFKSKDNCHYVRGIRDKGGDGSNLYQYYANGGEEEKKIAIFMDSDIIANDWELMEE